MGLFDEIKGRAKKAAGDLMGNKELSRSGDADRLTGHAKDAADAVSEKAKEVSAKAKDVANSVRDSVRDKAD